MRCVGTVRLISHAVSLLQSLDLGERGRNILKLVKLFLYIAVCSHIYGCIFYLVRALPQLPRHDVAQAAHSRAEHCCAAQVAAYEGHGKHSWTTLYGVGPNSDFPSTASQYQSALYWCGVAWALHYGGRKFTVTTLCHYDRAYTTLVTVGYGDISAHTDLEVRNRCANVPRRPCHGLGVAMR